MMAEDLPPNPPLPQEPVENFDEDQPPINRQLMVSSIRALGVAKREVTAYDVFKLAQWILGIATALFLTLALIRIFLPTHFKKADVPTYAEGIKEVWDYSKVVLNSIISLVLGLYFGSSKQGDKKDE